MSETTVQVTGVRKRFGSVQALGGVSFDAETGITGLLGPNGAGKTTLLRMMATVMSPDSGSLRLIGHDPTDPLARTAIRRSLGYMPQEPGFHRSFSAFAFIDYVAILKEMTDRRARHAEVMRVLDLVGLGDRARKKIRALSGGMRRRLALAQTLLGDPELLVLDEPTAGLDPEQRLRFRELISDIAVRQTVILSTHQTEDVATLCNRVIVMDEGIVLFDGMPSELAEIARGRVWAARERDARATLSWRTGDGMHRHIGVAPAGAHLIDPTIEDAYLLLVGHRADAENVA